MYLKEIEIENNGPIDFIKESLPFHDNGNPKPFLIIGKNGSGKSIFISHIVNSLISSKQTLYDDTDVEKGKVYKYRSPAYIKSGESFSRSKLTFEEDLSLSEWQLNRTKNEYEEFYKYTPINKEWNEIGANETSLFKSNYQNKIQQLKTLIDSNCLLYFPANRFEEPSWLNYGNLINRADYRFLNRTSNISNRQIINYSPLKDTQNWLLDVLFDKYTLEIQTQNINFPINQQGQQQINIPLPLFTGYQGESNNIHNAILQFLKSLFQVDEDIRFGVGKRRARNISLMKNEQSWIPNIFNLSSGETALLNIFLSIIKDFDLSNAQFTELSEIRGIVVIDEIDIHLHSNLQYKVLPELIKLFPKVQFIITTHSPLFLMGMRKEIHDDNFEVINLPTGEKADIERFSEFEKGYSYFKESEKYKTDLQSEINKSKLDFLFVEGDYDIKYIQKASQLLGQEELLANFQLVDSNGYGGIDKVYKHFDSKLADVTPQKMLLLYDCDTNKSNANKSNVFKRIINSITENPIEKGIENLFSTATIETAIQEKTAFVDKTPQITKLVRGEEITEPEKWEINPNEKRNLCDWLVENGAIDDFQNFTVVFDILNEIKNAT
jgi:predicted ATP-binding protein involved in virulence